MATPMTPRNLSCTSTVLLTASAAHSTLSSPIVSLACSRARYAPANCFQTSVWSASASCATRISSEVRTIRLRSRISYPSRANCSSFFMRSRLLRVGGILMGDMTLYVVLFDFFLADARQFFLGQHGEQLPAEGQSCFDIPVFGGALVDELSLEGLP